MVKRTPGDVARREVLADTLAGIQRVRAVVYVSAAATTAPIEKARQACAEYADRFNWSIVGEASDDVAASALPPLQRVGFVSAVHSLGQQQAEILLVADAAAISTNEADLTTATAHVEKCGAFVHIVRAVH